MDARQLRPSSPDLVITNARVLTLDSASSVVSGVVIKDGRIAALGSSAEIATWIGRAARVIDAQGAAVVPGFHDAHLHLLSYARSSAHLDLSDCQEPHDLLRRLTRAAALQPPGAWIRAGRFDEAAYRAALPDRHLLDRASAMLPIRLQHRSLHLDVLNTTALKRCGLWNAMHPAVERDATTGEPTGRLYHAAELLRDRFARPDRTEIHRDVAAACQQLASYGVTSIQDASITNGPEEWALFHDLEVTGNLHGLRLTMMPGLNHWRDIPKDLPPTDRLQLGPVKVMLTEIDEVSTALRDDVADARAHGHAVAIHAVSEAELIHALDLLLQSSSAMVTRGPDRIEHGAVIPEELINDIRRSGAMIVGQPGLVHDRGDIYRVDFDSALHGWVHRARSLLSAGIHYAIGSDAPVLEPRPLLGYLAAVQRRTRSGAPLGPLETLSAEQALRAITLGPAQAIGMGDSLGPLSVGAHADLTVLDPSILLNPTPEAIAQPVRLTIASGRVVWQG